MDNARVYKTIEEYNKSIGVETLHPLISLVDFSKITYTEDIPSAHSFGFYSVFLKDVKCGDLKYGRNYYDYQEGTLVFLAPNQIFTVENRLPHQPQGWALMFHPDLLRGTSLGHSMQNYTFFLYKVHEALHLSEQERKIVLECFNNIRLELNHDIDNHSQKLIVSNIELFLNYCTRFYERQFITRRHVNDDILTSDDVIVSAASCTTNCLAPIVKVLDDNFGIERGFMTTIHAYTNDQVTLDVSHKKGIKERRGRACAMNIVPTSTGAAIAIGKVIPSLDGKLSGGAIRVPVSDGSLVDLSLELTEKVTVEEINSAFINNASETLVTTTDPIVSSDVIGTTCGALADLSLTKVVEHDGKQMVKVISWYDNEMGYSAQMVRTAKKLLSL